MKKNALSFVLAGCVILSASALDLELRDGTTLPDIQFVRPALHGVTLITTDRTGTSHLVTVPFSEISIPSLYSLRQYLMRNNLPSWDSPQIDPPAWSASIAALNLYLRRYTQPAVMLRRAGAAAALRAADRLSRRRIRLKINDDRFRRTEDPAADESHAQPGGDQQPGAGESVFIEPVFEFFPENG